MSAPPPAWMRRMLPLFAVMALLLSLLLLAVAPSCARDVREPVAIAAGATVSATPPGNAVASAHALATEAGLQVMREGGNAFDAAIATSA